MKYEIIRKCLDSAAFVLLMSATPVLAVDSGKVPMMVADFDYQDTSGEVRDQTVSHAARMKIFAEILRERLADEGRFTILHLDCAFEMCSAGHMSSKVLIQATRDAGARLLMYGGIHKVSTLVQSGQIQVVDLVED